MAEISTTDFLEFFIDQNKSNIKIYTSDNREVSCCDQEYMLKMCELLKSGNKTWGGQYRVYADDKIEKETSSELLTTKWTNVAVLGDHSTVINILKGLNKKIRDGYAIFIPLRASIGTSVASQRVSPGGAPAASTSDTVGPRNRLFLPPMDDLYALRKIAEALGEEAEALSTKGL